MDIDFMQKCRFHMENDKGELVVKRRNHWGNRNSIFR